MTVTAIKNAWHSNGVSRLHAQVSRNMWKSIWPKLPENEVPITPITNGVHIYSWISHDMGELFDRYLGPRWRDDPLESELWHRIYEIPDEELWRTHERRRARLVAFARARLERDLASRGASQETIADASEVLNPEALIIGFARRFATYKRAALLFRDMDRLHKLTANREQPVQFIFAGKAHPRDDEGKKLIRQIIHAVREEPLRFRFIFLEDYNINVARYLVQGCDIWLNTPRRPLEASGTSGMKAVANGGLHLSVPDGWWAQAYHADYGWAIGRGEDYDDYEYQDSVECDALYDILEKEVTPMFYKRSVSGIPREWVSMMKRSMSNLIPRFSSHRMVWNYIDQAYIPADDSQRMLAADNYDRARALAGWRVKVEENWDGVRVEDIAVDQHEEIQVGDRIKLKARINLGGLAPEDVRVEAYSGPVDSRGNFQQALGVEMQRDEGGKGAQHEYLATLVAPQSGHFGFTVRLFPRNQDLQNRFAMYRVTWADNG
jgi:starch phosphorylase